MTRYFLTLNVRWDDFLTFADGIEKYPPVIRIIIDLPDHTTQVAVADIIETIFDTFGEYPVECNVMTASKIYLGEN